MEQLVTVNRQWQIIKEAMDVNDLETAVKTVNKVIEELKETRSILALKEKLNSIEEDQLLPILRALDVGLMNQYSSFLVRYMYRHKRSVLSEILFYGEASNGTKVVEGEEMLRKLVEDKKDSLSLSLKKSAYRAWFYLLLDMKRFQEAKSILEIYESLEEESLIDRWGYYYFYAGDWSMGEQLLQQGIREGVKPHYCILTLQTLYTAKGNIQEALDLLNDGIEKYPYFLPLYIEKINKLKVLERWEEVQDTMVDLDKLTPYHYFHKYFIFSRGQFLYSKSATEEFQEYVEEHKQVFKGSPYANCPAISQGNICQLPTRVFVQKYNYCGPTTASMLLSRYGIEKSQEEIGETIFSINGAKTLMMVEYLQELGMECRFFFGSRERFKELSKNGVSVVLCVDYTSSSHVQLLKGFDDNLQAYYIQDPNNAETLVISYDDFEKHYGNNLQQAIAVIPKGEMEKLRHINEGEHRLILEMYQLADRVELDYKAREPFLSFVKTHCDSLFVAAFAIKMISFEEEAELLEQLIQYTMEQHPEQDYFKLIGAGALVKVKKYEVAMALLESVSVRKSFDYFYLKGRIAFEQYNYKAAISSFREALNIEPDHYHTWSYLGISYLNLGDMETALYYSTISIDINKNDDWNRLNHGIILSDRQNYQEARIVFSEILRSFKNHVPSWIERARCDVALNKLHQAVRGLKTAKSLMPDLPSTYIELANIYWGNYSDGVGAVQELKEGIDQAGKQYPLLVRLGEIFEDQGDFAEAKVWYEEAWQQSPNESYSFLSITRVLSELSGVREGLEHLLSGEKSFVGDCQFLINGGKWLFENGEIGEHRELALTWLETGMDLADSNEPEAWDMYVGLIEDSSYCDRGRSFFAKLLKEKHESNIELVTYIGYLFERENDMGNAIHYYEKALEIGEHTFPYYRLGEVAFSQNQLEEAKEWYKKMSLLDPTMTAPLLKLAEMASMKEETRLEQDYLFQVMKRCPFDVNMIHFAQLSFEEGKLPEVVDYLKKNEATLDGVWRFYALAQCEGALGNIESEEAYLIQGLKLDPDDFNLQESYAVLKLKQGDYEEACSLLKNLIMIDLEYRPLYALLSEALLESGMIKNTSKFLQAIDLSNEEKSFVFMYTANELEQCLWDMVSEGVVEKKLLKLLKKTVVELYETSLRFNKENDTAFIWLMEYYNTRNGDLDYSIKMCSKRLKNSWSFDLGFYLSQLIINNYVEQHHRKKETEYARAEVILFQCLEEDPDHPGVHYALGRLYNELNAIEEGEASLLRAMVLDPSDHDIYYETSRLFEKKGDFKRGEEMVRKCIELQPEFLLAYNQLSILLHQQGKTLDAMEVIDELIGMDEGNALAHYNKACYLSALKKDPFVALEHLTLAINNDEGHYLKELGKTDLDLRHLFENHATSSKMKQLFR